MPPANTADRKPANAALQTPSSLNTSYSASARLLGPRDIHVGPACRVARLHLDIRCFGVECLDVGNLVLCGQLARELANNEGVAVAGHFKHGLHLALRVNIRGLLKIQESPRTGYQQAFADHLNHVVMPFFMHHRNLQLGSRQRFTIGGNDVKL